jgi:hypothetical protein
MVLRPLRPTPARPKHLLPLTIITTNIPVIRMVRWLKENMLKGERNSSTEMLSHQASFRSNITATGWEIPRLIWLPWLPWLSRLPSERPANSTCRQFTVMTYHQTRHSPRQMLLIPDNSDITGATHKGQRSNFVEHTRIFTLWVCFLTYCCCSSSSSSDARQCFDLFHLQYSLLVYLISCVNCKE